ncbi:MAG: gamma carbonic anhydrase family protein [Chloroflexota bacterium]|nr:gamma carbonic anhydrase family protein [Chloroflexota bacterium]
MIESFDGKTPRIAESAFVHESANVIGDVEIGDNCIVWPGAVIRGDFGPIKIGRNVFVEDNCVLHVGDITTSRQGEQALTDIGFLEIGDNVIIGHAAVINGKRIGSNVLIGISVSILHNVEIGDYCIVAAGAVVMMGSKIPARSFVAGMPAEIKGEAKEEHLRWVGRSELGVDIVRKMRK